MDEPSETRIPSFPETLDSLPTLLSKDTLVTTELTPDVPTYLPTEPPILLYDTDTSDLINSMATKPDNERSTPFLQRVQLLGPGNYLVCATGQVDDGAMRNCISKQRWDHYGHCLSPLEPSTMRIKVANGSRIVPVGRWYGTVRVGNVGSPSWFKVFECDGAFDVILGKRWLRAVKAIHDYSTNEITITYDGNSDTIPNSAAHLDDKIHSVITPTKEDNTPVPETDPIEQLDHEWARIHQIRASASPWQETRWSQYLDVDILDDDEDTEDDNYNYEGLSDLYLIEGEASEGRRRAAST